MKLNPIAIVVGAVVLLLGALALTGAFDGLSFDTSTTTASDTSGETAGSITLVDRANFKISGEVVAVNSANVLLVKVTEAEEFSRLEGKTIVVFSTSSAQLEGIEVGDNVSAWGNYSGLGYITAGQKSGTFLSPSGVFSTTLGQLWEN